MLRSTLVTHTGRLDGVGNHLINHRGTHYSLFRIETTGGNILKLPNVTVTSDLNSDFQVGDEASFVFKKLGNAYQLVGVVDSLSRNFIISRDYEWERNKSLLKLSLLSPIALASAVSLADFGAVALALPALLVALVYRVWAQPSRSAIQQALDEATPTPPAKAA